MSQQNLASSLGAKVTVVTVTESFPFDASAAGIGWAPLPQDISCYEEGQKKVAEKLLASVWNCPARIAPSADVLHVADARPAEVTVEVAKAKGCSLIVMASHGRRGLGRLLLGSQGQDLLIWSKLCEAI